MGNEKEKTLDEKDIQFFQEQLKKGSRGNRLVQLAVPSYEAEIRACRAYIELINSSDKKLEEEK
jgi:hypothetical protein